MRFINVLMLISAALCITEGRQYFRKRTGSKARAVPELKEKLNLKINIPDKIIPKVAKIPEIQKRPPLLIKNCPPVNCPAVVIPADCIEETYFRHEGSRCKGCDRNSCEDNTGINPPQTLDNINPSLPRPPVRFIPANPRLNRPGSLPFDPRGTGRATSPQGIPTGNIGPWEDSTLRQARRLGAGINGNTFPLVPGSRTEFPAFDQSQRRPGISDQWESPALGWANIQNQQWDGQLIPGQGDLTSVNPFSERGGFPRRFEAGLDTTLLNNQPISRFAVGQGRMNTGNTQIRTDPFAVRLTGAEQFFTRGDNFEQFQGVQFQDPTIQNQRIIGNINTIRNSNDRSQWLRNNVQNSQRIPRSENSWATSF